VILIDTIVLAGGRSLRMGSDKASLVVDGRRMIEHAVDAVRPLGGQVLVARGEQPRLGVGHEIADEPGLDGPLAGIVGAIDLVRTEVVAIVAVDMPSIDPAVLRRLAALMLAAGRAAAIPVVGGVPQPLHAVLSSSVMPLVRDLAMAGERSPRRVFAHLDALVVGPDGWQDLDASGAFARDWDTPADLGSTR
jgi:molybdenum cofactor guanylyltransferase